MLSYVRPDYGDAKKNAGGTVGAEANIGGMSHLRPSVQFRAVGSGGRLSDQYAYSIGPRAEFPFGHFRPYADFLFGYGIIKYERPQIVNGKPYTSDNSLVYTYGGGLDYELSRHWAIRADLQRQRWKVGDNNPAFHPVQMSLGVRYRFHFHNKYGPD